MRREKGPFIKICSILVCTVFTFTSLPLNMAFAVGDGETSVETSSLRQNVYDEEHERNTFSHIILRNELINGLTRLFNMSGKVRHLNEREYRPNHRRFRIGKYYDSDMKKDEKEYEITIDSKGVDSDGQATHMKASIVFMEPEGDSLVIHRDFRKDQTKIIIKKSNKQIANFVTQKGRNGKHIRGKIKNLTTGRWERLSGFRGEGDFEKARRLLMEGDGILKVWEDTVFSDEFEDDRPDGQGDADGVKFVSDAILFALDQEDPYDTRALAVVDPNPDPDPDPDPDPQPASPVTIEATDVSQIADTTDVALEAEISNPDGRTDVIYEVRVYDVSSGTPVFVRTQILDPTDTTNIFDTRMNLPASDYRADFVVRDTEETLDDVSVNFTVTPLPVDPDPEPEPDPEPTGTDILHNRTQIASGIYNTDSYNYEIALTKYAALSVDVNKTTGIYYWTDGTKIFSSDPDNPIVYRVPPPPQNVIGDPHIGTIQSLSVNQETGGIYWLEVDAVHYMDAEGNTSRFLIRAFGDNTLTNNPYLLVRKFIVDEKRGKMYFLSGGGENHNRIGTYRIDNHHAQIWQYDLETGEADVIPVLADENIRTFGFDQEENALYWTSKKGPVKKTHLTGLWTEEFPETFITTGTENIESIAINGSYFFIGTNDVRTNGTAMRIKVFDKDGKARGDYVEGAFTSNDSAVLSAMIVNQNGDVCWGQGANGNQGTVQCASVNPTAAANALNESNDAQSAILQAAFDLDQRFDLQYAGQHTVNSVDPVPKIFFVIGASGENTPYSEQLAPYSGPLDPISGLSSVEYFYVEGDGAVFFARQTPVCVNPSPAGCSLGHDISSMKVAQLDSSYYTDHTKLENAIDPQSAGSSETDGDSIDADEVVTSPSHLSSSITDNQDGSMTLTVTIDDPDGNVSDLQILDTRQAILLAHQYNLRQTTSLETVNASSADEKWLMGTDSEGNDVMFCLYRDGKLYMSHDSSENDLNHDNDEMIHDFADSMYFDHLQILYDAADISVLDDLLERDTDFPMENVAYEVSRMLGLTQEDTSRFNELGQEEKWLTGIGPGELDYVYHHRYYQLWDSGAGDYFITPQGQLLRRDSTTSTALSGHVIVANLDPMYYLDPSKLIQAKDTVNPIQETSTPSLDYHAYMLDQLWNLNYRPNDFNDFGMDEIWFSGGATNGDRYFMLPDGSLYKRRAINRPDQAFYVGSLDSSFYDDPTKLADAFNNGVHDSLTMTHTWTFNRETTAGGATHIYYLAMSGSGEPTLMKAEFTVEGSSQEESGEGSNQEESNDPETTPSSDPLINDIVALDRLYNFSPPTNDIPNWGGLDEVWVMAARQQSHMIQHFITPDGNLYRWNRQRVDNQIVLADQILIGNVGASVFANRNLLYNAFDDFRETINVNNIADINERAAELDRLVEWEVPYPSSNNALGLGEKWVRSVGFEHYYITPTGGIYFWLRNEEDIHLGDLDSSYYDDLEKLINANELEQVGYPSQAEYQAAYDFDLQFGLENLDYFNLGGQQEVWFESTIGDESSWLYLRPYDMGDGTVEYRLYRWASGIVSEENDEYIGTLHARFYFEKSLLWDAQDPETFEIPSNNVNDPNNANDPEDNGDAQNPDPQEENPDSNATSDPDYVQIAFDLDQSLDLRFLNYVNLGGLGEKWFEDQAGIWYYMIQDGGVYRWSGHKDLSSDILVAQLNQSYYDDPSKLTNAVHPEFVRLQQTAFDLHLQYGFSDSAYGYLNISPDNAAIFSGLEEKYFTTRDGLIFYILPDGRLFQWNLGTVGEENDTLIAELHALFYIDKSLLFNAQDPQGVNTTDPSEPRDLVQLASTWDQALDLVAIPDEFENAEGKGEKWLRDSAGNWYYVTPDGTLYRDFGDNYMEIARFDSTYHADLSKIHGETAIDEETVEEGSNSDGNGSNQENNTNEEPEPEPVELPAVLIESFQMVQATDSPEVTFTMTVDNPDSADNIRLKVRIYRDLNEHPTMVYEADLEPTETTDVYEAIVNLPDGDYGIEFVVTDDNDNTIDSETSDLTVTLSEAAQQELGFDEKQAVAYILKHSYNLQYSGQDTDTGQTTPIRKWFITDSLRDNPPYSEQLPHYDGPHVVEDAEGPVYTELFYIEPNGAVYFARNTHYLVNVDEFGNGSLATHIASMPVTALDSSYYTDPSKLYGAINPFEALNSLGSEASDDDFAFNLDELFDLSYVGTTPDFGDGILKWFSFSSTADDLPFVNDLFYRDGPNISTKRDDDVYQDRFYIRPDGKLFFARKSVKLDGEYTSFVDTLFVRQMDTSFYDDPTKLTDAVESRNAQEQESNSGNNSGDSGNNESNDSQSNALATLAYNLDQQYDFSTLNERNILGLDEKWLLGKNGYWYYIYKEGELYNFYKYDSNSPTLLGTFNQSYYDDINLLVDVPAPTN